MKTIQTLGEHFVKQHNWLLSVAKSCEVALCGGCAAAVVSDNQHYIPIDIDFATTKANALRFIDAINHFLIDRSVHYRIYVNSKNSFVPEPALSHFRVQCPFWLPVCLFVLPHDEFHYFRIQGGHLVQLPEEIAYAADQMTELDDRPRLASKLADMDLGEIDLGEPETGEDPDDNVWDYEPQEITNLPDENDFNYRKP